MKALVLWILKLSKVLLKSEKMENWQNNYFITHEYKNILDDENNLSWIKE